MGSSKNKKTRRYIKRKTCSKIIEEIFYKRKDLIFKYNIQQICSFYKISNPTLVRNLMKRYRFDYTAYRRWRIREYVKENHGKKTVPEICDYLLIGRTAYYRYLNEKYCTGGDRKSSYWRLTERIYFNKKEL